MWWSTSLTAVSVQSDICTRPRRPERRSMDGHVNDTMRAATGGPEAAAHTRADVHSEYAITLFCIPHAGGGASAYRNWAAGLAPQVVVKVLQLRGRESRFREPPLTELRDVLADLYRAV